MYIDEGTNKLFLNQINWGITKGSTWCLDKCVQSENENLLLNFYLPLNPVLFLHLLYRWKVPPCVP
jgi:hypothetical protein